MVKAAFGDRGCKNQVLLAGCHAHLAPTAAHPCQAAVEGRGPCVMGSRGCLGLFGVCRLASFGAECCCQGFLVRREAQAPSCDCPSSQSRQAPGAPALPACSSMGKLRLRVGGRTDLEAVATDVAGTWVSGRVLYFSVCGPVAFSGPQNSSSRGWNMGAWSSTPFSVHSGCCHRRPPTG